MMKISTFTSSVLLVFSLSSLISAQSTFNKMYPLLDNIAHPVYVVPDTSNFYCIGYGTNDNPYSQYGLFFSIFDSIGNLKKTIFYQEPETKFFFGNRLQNALVFGNFIYYTIRRSKSDFYYLIKQNKHTGEIEDKIKIINKFYENGLIDIRFLEKIDSISFALISMITEDNQIESDTNFYYTDIQIDYFTVNSSELKSVHYGKPKVNEWINTVIWLGDRYLVSDIKYENDFCEDDYKAQSIIYTLDTIGNLELSYQTNPDSIRDRIWDIELANDDEGFVMINNKISKYYLWNDCILMYKPFVVKLDANFQEVWEVDITGTYLDYHAYNELVRIIPSNDNDGYIVAGRVMNNMTPGTLFEGDSLYVKDKVMSYGMLTKILNDGTRDWTRYFSIVKDTTGSLVNTHKIVDLESSYDGGYLMAGELNYYGIKNWILKVDEYGCLIPGCEDFSDVEEHQNQSDPFILYPNPVHDELYIYHSNPNKYKYAVFNQQGQLMDRFYSSFENETIIVPVKKYPEGIYFVACADENGKRLTKTFIKN